MAIAVVLSFWVLTIEMVFMRFSIFKKSTHLDRMLLGLIQLRVCVKRVCSEFRFFQVLYRVE